VCCGLVAGRRLVRPHRRSQRGVPRQGQRGLRGVGPRRPRASAGCPAGRPPGGQGGTGTRHRAAPRIRLPEGYARPRHRVPRSGWQGPRARPPRRRDGRRRGAQAGATRPGGRPAHLRGAPARLGPWRTRSSAAEPQHRDGLRGRWGATAGILAERGRCRHRPARGHRLHQRHRPRVGTPTPRCGAHGATAREPHRQGRPGCAEGRRRRGQRLRRQGRTLRVARRQLRLPPERMWRAPRRPRPTGRGCGPERRLFARDPRTELGRWPGGGGRGDTRAPSRIRRELLVPRLRDPRSLVSDPPVSGAVGALAAGLGERGAQRALPGHIDTRHGRIPESGPTGLPARRGGQRPSRRGREPCPTLRGGHPCVALGHGPR